MADLSTQTNGNGIFLKVVLGLITTLVAAGVLALWSSNARLAVVESNTANIKEVIADHEVRMRRLERLAAGGGLLKGDGL